MNKEWNVISVLWSGGLDSTYLIQYLLEQNLKNIVWAYYVEIENNTEKVVMELNAIKQPEMILKKKYANRFQYCGVSCRFFINNISDNLVFYQMPLWIAAVICTTSNKVKEIAVGYVMNDDAISYLLEFKKIVKAFNSISYEPYPKISFPLSKINKNTILDKIDPELKKHVVWCERPRGLNSCGKCYSCERSPLLKTHKRKKIL
jgi:7-cyano-7-deazaguanine synthase in queuosine biosynthesis